MGAQDRMKAIEDREADCRKSNSEQHKEIFERLDKVTTLSSDVSYIRESLDKMSENIENVKSKQADHNTKLALVEKGMTDFIVAHDLKDKKESEDRRNFLAIGLAAVTVFATLASSVIDFFFTKK